MTEYSWKGKKNLDHKVSKDLNLGLLKQLIEKVGTKFPNIVPPVFEDLQYEESRWLYKLKVDLNYVYQIEDYYAEMSPAREKDGRGERYEPIGGYKTIVNNMLNFLIVLCEADSFYRFRVKHLKNFVENDLLLNHYFQMIRKFGMEEKWNRGKILDIRLRAFGFQPPNPSIWEHHLDKPVFQKMDKEIRDKNEN